VLAAAAGVGFGLLPGRWRWLALPAVLAALPLHWRANDLGRIRIADGHARAALASAPQGAILLTGGDTSTHALWFVQGTERVRPDVAVVSPGHVSGWHVPQLRRRHPEIAWPADEEIARGTWLATLLRAEVARRPVCLLEPPELRLPGWGAGELLEAWRGVAEGVLFRLERAERPADRARLARAVEAWRRLSPPGARELADADVQVVMSAFTLAVARFALAGELLEAGDAAEGAAQLRALAAAEPDAMEARMAEAYAAIGRGIPRLRLGARAARALGASGAPAMLAALAPL
jgi:hypothetical protein